MREVARLLNEMLRAGVILDYAVFGAIAQMRYTEAVATLDADILVAIPPGGNLDLLRPILDYCAAHGYTSEGEAIRVGDWPVQFIPAFNAITEEAMREAQTGEIDGVPLRVLRADHLALIALSTARPKDFARILSLLEAKVITVEELAKLSARHGLAAEWQRFHRRFLG